jgi:hypothetical protein
LAPPQVVNNEINEFPPIAKVGKFVQFDCRGKARFGGISWNELRCAARHIAIRVASGVDLTRRGGTGNIAQLLGFGWGLLLTVWNAR